MPLSIRVLIIALANVVVVSMANAQQSSLFHETPSGNAAAMYTPQGPLIELPGQRSTRSGQQVSARTSPDLDMSAASWTYMPPSPRRTFRLQEIVTIRVDELARVSAEGGAESRRNMFYDALLKDWVSLSGGKLRPAQQGGGDPRVNGQSNQQFRADASFDSRESLAFSIAARVVDIQPNGNRVLEANKTMWINDNQFETSLTGICRAQDIAPDNVVLSRDLLDLNIRKNEKGQLRDSYKRGWLTRWIGELNPF
jgi:flagellar L-ring protein precursor FlgH